jgi:beta-1,4-mannosyl-glycoprotein beta-1,4-N-acetylglucosaminyltransferase
MKIIDCFMLGLDYELDLLELRLEYLYPIVDHFVIVEANFTHTGNLKKLFFEENKIKFLKYADKIIYVKVDGPISTEYKTWENEFYQRNQIMVGLDRIGIKSNDIIIISDLDEFPSHDAINFYITKKIDGLGNTTQDMYFYYLNWKANITWSGSQFVRGHMLMSGSTPQSFRDIRKKKNKLKIHGGWHFSYMGGTSAILSKISSISEAPLLKSIDLDKIDSAIINKTFLSKDNIVITPINILAEQYPESMKNKVSQLMSIGLIKE